MPDLWAQFLSGSSGTTGVARFGGFAYPAVHTTCTSRIRSIIAPSATNTLTPICRTWPCQEPITRTASSPWPYAWWSKTDCRTKRPVGTYGGTIGCLCPLPPSRTGWRPGGKKAEARIDADYLDWALADFSGYIAADELYDGPYCVLSIVDNRTFKRIFYRVLDHDPTHDDIREFFTAFRAALEAGDCFCEASPPMVRPCILGRLPRFFRASASGVRVPRAGRNHQGGAPRGEPRCASNWTAQKAPLGRGRPAASRPSGRPGGTGDLQQKIGDLFEHRHLFVAHHLTPAERRILQRITRGLPQLRTLREIMDEVYRLFDRRCRTDTALAKLAKLRMRVRRFRKVGKTLSKLFSPNLEKALTFLDDTLLPATSNAVERGNRRHRKMQKTIYRVRTQQHIHARIAIDMLRDAQATGRFDTTQTLHHARAG